MIYHHLFTDKKVYAAVIGAGHFCAAIVTQQAYNDCIIIPLIADKNLDNARGAYLKAEIPEELIVYCDTAEAAQSAIEEGKFVYTDHTEIIMDTPIIDIVCEGTGVPEAGARNCKLALEKGKHVAIVSKEMDSVIGPILNKMAKEKGLVYTPVDGDQHGLLMQMVEWAKLVGLEVISAGKARDGEFILDEANKTVSIACDGITVHEDCVANIPDDMMKYMEMIPKGHAEEYVAKRGELLHSLPNAGAFDLCELTIMANCTGLKPAVPDTSKATLRITELPVAYCAKKNGGIYEDEGIIDVHTNFRRADESGMGGGVFMVVRCNNAYSNYILTTKGQIPNYDKSTAVIYRPYHLCGVEVGTTLLAAGQLGISTGARCYVPTYDLVKRAECDIKAGEVLGNDHDLRMTASIVPATKMAPASPIPAHMITGNVARVDIKAGETITYDMIAAPADSVLWELRKMQEETAFEPFK
ncbi:MAG: SAF domain-containing protein [Angelakisella sp.]|nr:SAF domain-containing protein [Angelakisella sp.]